MKIMLATTALLATFATAASATSVRNETDVYNRLIAAGYSEADARSTAKNYASQHLNNANQNRNNNTNLASGGDGGDALGLGVAAGGSAAQRQALEATTGDLAATTTVTVQGDRTEYRVNPAYAPDVAAGSNYNCDRFIGFSFGGNGDSRSISGGLGIPYENGECAKGYAATLIADLTGNMVAASAVLATLDVVKKAGIVFDPTTGELVVITPAQ